MNNLQLAYDEFISYDINKLKINPRKTSLQTRFCLLKGGFASGKTYLIHDTLKNIDKEYILYIDFLVYKNKDIKINNKLFEFVAKTNITHIVFENIQEINKESITILDRLKSTQTIEQIIITSYEIDGIDGFDVIYCNLLDYEEHMLFYPTSKTNLFVEFLRGNSNKIGIDTQSKSQIKTQSSDNNRIRDILSYVKNTDEFNWFMFMLGYCDKKVSIYSMYLTYKTNNKISKDYFYKLSLKYQNNGVLFYCDKYASKNSAKKLYFYNHTLHDLNSYSKNLQATLCNMVYLQLISKYNIDNIYYYDFITFYLPKQKLAILVNVFFSDEFIANNTASIIRSMEQIEIEKIELININTTNTIYIDDIKCDILPFETWALL